MQGLIRTDELNKVTINPNLCMKNEIFMTRWNGHKELVNIMRCNCTKHKWIVADEWIPIDECRWIRWETI